MRVVAMKRVIKMLIRNSNIARFCILKEQKNNGMFYICISMQLFPAVDFKWKKKVDENFVVQEN